MIGLVRIPYVSVCLHRVWAPYDEVATGGLVDQCEVNRLSVFQVSTSHALPLSCVKCSEADLFPIGEGFRHVVMMHIAIQMTS